MIALGDDFEVNRTVFETVDKSLQCEITTDLFVCVCFDMESGRWMAVREIETVAERIDAFISVSRD